MAKQLFFLLLLAAGLGAAQAAEPAQSGAAWRAIAPTNNVEAIAKFVDLVKEKATVVGEAVVLMKGKNSKAQHRNMKHLPCSIRITLAESEEYLYEVLTGRTAQQSVTFRGVEDFDPSPEKAGFVMDFAVQQPGKKPYVHNYAFIYFWDEKTAIVAGFDGDGNLDGAYVKPYVGCVCEEK